MRWLKEQFSLLREFLRSDFRRMFLLCALGMVCACALGVGFSLARPDAAMEGIGLFITQAEQSGVVDEYGRMSVFALLLNNWRAMLLSAAYGFIPFLFLPVFSLLSNGVLLGVTAAVYVSNEMSLGFLLAGILPHGVFELPALVLSIACGVYLCRNMCRLVTSSPSRIPMVELLGDLLRVLVLLVAPMTVAAAFIECYVTPVIMGLLI